MIVEIKGVQFINKGAELMLASIYQEFKNRNAENVSFALSPRNSPYLKRLEYAPYQKVGNLFKRIDFSKIDWLLPDTVCKTYGLVKHKDIDVVLDASGFAYGDQWTPAMLRHSVKQAQYMKKLGKKYIFMPQAMGPFTTPAYRKLIKEAVQASTIMFVRDKKSLTYITDIVGERENVILSPDFTNIVKGPEVECTGERELKVATVIPNNKMLSKQNKNSFGSFDYLDEIVKGCLLLQEKGYKIKVLNHEGVKDLELCKKIFSRIDSDNAILIESLGPLEIKREIKDSSLVICSRFHGCVSSLSQGVPVVGTSWSHKYEMLYRDYNVLELLYKFDVPLNELITNSLSKMETLAAEIRRNAEIEKSKTLQMWDKIFREIF